MCVQILLPIISYAFAYATPGERLAVPILALYPVMDIRHR